MTDTLQTPATDTPDPNIGFSGIIHEYRLAMADFNNSMKLRDELSVRIGKRTTQIIRFSMIGMTLLTAAMFFLIYTLTTNMNDITTRMNDMSKYMSSMNDNFVEITNNMKIMQQSVDKMARNIEVMPQMNQAILAMGQDIQAMDASMEKMQKSMSTMDSNIQIMSINMAAMSNHLGMMTGQVSGIGYSVNRMAGPMQFFPFAP